MRSFGASVVFCCGSWLACGDSAGPTAKSILDSPALPVEPQSDSTQIPAAPEPWKPAAMPPSGLHYGATLTEHGALFRVWAPNAKSVSVIGDIASAGALLTPDKDGGTFAREIEGARAGHRYRFVIETPEGTKLQRQDPRGRSTTPSTPTGIWSVIDDARAYAWKSARFTPPRREEAVVMEIHLPSFSAARGEAHGSFLSAIERLDSLRDLGINVIELMPVNAFGTDYGWGYNPFSFFSVHTPLGKPEDLRRLVDEAHARGIAVVLDAVYNHTDRNENGPLYCFDGACPSPSAGIYYFEQDPYRLTPWGPRPHFAKKEVSDYLVDNAWTWIDEYRVDGFRIDSVSNIRAIDGQGSVPGGSELMRRMNEVVHRAKPGALMIAEDLKGFAPIAASVEKQGLGFDTQWDGGFNYAVATAVTAADDNTRDLNAVLGSLFTRYNDDPFQRVIYSENHDTVGNGHARIPSRVDGANPGSMNARKRSMLAAALVFTSPGVPMIFQGQEMLLSGTFSDLPLPMDWNNATTNSRVRDFYRDMIRLRRNADGISPALLGAKVDVTHKNDQGGNKAFVMRRSNGNAAHDMMVLVNLTGRTYTAYDLGLPTGGTWNVRIDTDDPKYGKDFGGTGTKSLTARSAVRDKLPFTGTIPLGAYSVVVLGK